MSKIAFLFFLFVASFSYAQPLSGTYTIGGSNPDYINLFFADAALDSFGISGPVTFNIRSGAYLGHIIIDSITGATDTSWVTFQSETGDSSDVVLKGIKNTSQNRAVGLDYSRFIRFRNVTFEAGDKTDAAVIVFLGHDFEFLNCVFRGDTNTVHDDALMSGIADSNLLIRNCLFTGSEEDFVSLSISSRNNIRLEKCIFNAGGYGVRAADISNFEIVGCRFYDTFDRSGINRAISLRTIQGFKMYGNLIDFGDVNSEYRAVEFLGLGSRDSAYIANNVIITATDLSTNNAAITFGFLSGSVRKAVVAHNTFVFKSPNPNNAVFKSFNCDLAGTRIYNNIIVNESGGYLFDNCAYPTDYNLLYTTGAISPLDSSLAQLQQSGRDSNSIFALPMFDALIPGLSHAPQIDSGGYFFPRISKDILGNFRDPKFPDIGPYEFINPPVVRFPIDSTVCESVELNAGNPGSQFIWSTGDTTQSILIDSTGNYWVTATNSKGSNTDTILVIIDSLALPPYQLISSLDSLCLGGCATLSVSLDSTLFQLVWNESTGQIGGGGVQTVCPAALPATYYLEISDGGACRQMDSITIYPKTALPVLSISNDTTICFGDSVLLSVNSPDAIQSVQWSPQSAISGINGNSAWASPDSIVKIKAVVNFLSGCKDSAEVEVSVHYVAQPIVQLVFDTLYVDDRWDTYQWTVNGSPIATAIDTFWVALQNGSYTLRVTDSSGCSTFSNPYNFNRFSQLERFKKLLSVYPNPVREILSLEVGSGFANSHLEILNSVGQVVPTIFEQIGLNSFQLNTEGLPSGVYLLKASSDGQVGIVRFIKQ